MMDRPVPMLRNPLRNRSTSFKWQYVLACVVSLVGAFFGGLYGGLVAAFAGDSWWNSDFALSCFQYALAVGGVCVGAVPGMVWLLCLRQKWVLPFLCVATCALLLPLFEMRLMGNDSLGLIYAGAVVFGFVVGLLFWIQTRRTAKRRNGDRYEALGKATDSEDRL